MLGRVTFAQPSIVLVARDAAAHSVFIPLLKIPAITPSK